jgi:thiamine pyrophosphokinase
MDCKKEFYKNFFFENREDIFCADGGLKYIKELNLFPKELWGDLDSVSQEELEWARTQKAQIKKFSREKDETDGELLIKSLKKRGYEKIKIFSGLGGRVDHFLTNLNLGFKYEGLEFYGDNEQIIVLKKSTKIVEIKNKTISFIPFSDQVTKLTLKGVKYPLENYTLERGSSRCMSNIAIENEIDIEFENGKLLCMINYKIEER